MSTRRATRPASRSTARHARRWDGVEPGALALVPLRLFLGVTFLYAGMQKLADRWFFKASAPSSLQAQLHAAARTSPLGSIAAPLAHVALPVGLLIAFGEIAAGTGALVGLWTRWAAALGLLFSTGFLLLVSWHTKPYYYGADVVFVFAWMPLVIAGAGPWSLDGRAREEARESLGLPAGASVAIEFSQVQHMCGAYDRGRCKLQRGRACSPVGCPVLTDPAVRKAEPEIDRRAVLRRAGIAGWLAAAAAAGGGLVAVLGRLVPPAPSTRLATGKLSAGGTATSGAPTSSAATTSPAQPGPTAAPATTAPAAGGVAGGTRIGPASGVPVGGAAQFTDPSSGDPAYALQPAAGRFLAFDAVCPHQGCTVEYSGTEFQCPCHGARFDSSSGAVLRGPARQGLAQIQIQRAPDGNLYVM